MLSGDSAELCCMIAPLGGREHRKVPACSASSPARPPRGVCVYGGRAVEANGGGASEPCRDGPRSDSVVPWWPVHEGPPEHSVMVETGPRGNESCPPWQAGLCQASTDIAGSGGGNPPLPTWTYCPDHCKSVATKIPGHVLIVLRYHGRIAHVPRRNFPRNNSDTCARS